MSTSPWLQPESGWCQMISKVMAGSSFSGALGYASEKEKAEFITKGGVFNDDAKGIAAEMAANADQRKLKTPVLHVALSLPPGERATADQWRIAAETYLTKMGFDLNKSQYAVYRHNDRDHDHIHIIANRVQLDGQVISDGNHWRRSHEATRHAEKAAGLSQLQKSDGKMQKGHMHQLRTAIDKALDGGASLAQFRARLAQAGIQLKENRASTGRLAGLSFKDQSGRIWKGSALGKEYSALALARRGLDLSTEKSTVMAREVSQSMTVGGKGGSMPPVGGGLARADITWKLKNRVGGLSVAEKDRLRGRGGWLRRKEHEL